MSNSSQKMDYKEPIPVYPTVKRIFTVGVGTLLLTNALFRVPVIGDSLAFFRKSVHSLLDLVGGSEYKKDHEGKIHAKDAALDFAMDMAVTLTGLVGLYRFSPDAARKLIDVMHHIENMPDKAFEVVGKAINNLRGISHQPALNHTF